MIAGHGRTDALIDGLAQTARSLRDEAGAVSEFIGHFAEVARQLADQLAEVDQENADLRATIAELRARLAGRTNDTTDTE